MNFFLFTDIILSFILMSDILNIKVEIDFQQLLFLIKHKID